MQVKCSYKCNFEEHLELVHLCFVAPLEINSFLITDNITPDRRQSRTIFYLKVSRPILPNKEFSIAKMAIIERKLDVFDCHNIDFGNQKRRFRQLLKNWRSPLPHIRCERGRRDVPVSVLLDISTSMRIA